MHQVELKYLFNGEPRSQVFEFEQDQWILRGDALAPEGRYQIYWTSRATAAQQQTGSRKPRQVKVYKKPHTGEVVETKGGSHKILKEWKSAHGAATVEPWLGQ